MIKKKLLIPAILALGLVAAGCSFPDINLSGIGKNQSAQSTGSSGPTNE